ncbi:PHD finger protein 20 isoform X1 [Triplophysa dalaica]|uniref:PHD finger protein 20 isoform X1 n=2 Tax=Triplophysa dalaica TaxID=1582913 RepID=UPI0024DFA129|nr:PHD finger protein 20 isoform X1 [Triplophysa dalaica]XP_056590524.1 PHD finger protein 20 isoform X1 [Triplophysa dalaica]
MSKIPPNRRGITFEVGAALEARDSLKNWYAANIEKIDYDDEKVLIHYRQWGHRHDEWFDWTSPYLRAMERERVQLRREGLQEDNIVPGFHVNEKVLASWSDCRFYPAKVLAVNKDASYTVKFYDGVIQTVKGIHVKPFIRERRKKLSNRNGEKAQVKKPDNVHKMHENGEEEKEVSDWDGNEDDQKKSRIQGRSTGRKNEENVMENMSMKEENEEGGRVLEQIGQHNYSKSFLKKDSGHERRGEKTAVKIEDDAMVLDSCIHFNEGMLKVNRIEEAEVQAEQKEKDIEGFPHDKKSQRHRVRGKRRISMARRKKSKTDSDKSFHNGCESTPELINQRASGNGQDSEPSLLTQPSNNTSDTPKPTVRKQAFHNPSRFSREPLYRVVRNQPPPVLSINLDHNPYKCSATGCAKSFRKAKLLHYHMKYYHGDIRAVDDDLAMNTGNQTDVFSQEKAFNNQNGSKKRCIALSTVPVNKGTDAQMRVKRRSSAPPAFSAQNYQQWSSLKKTREKLDNNEQRCFDKEREKRYVEIGVKEYGRLKGKRSRDFLHFKLKKNKKMRMTTSDEESLSDWSSDSCGWSDDDMGTDLAIMPSPLSCSSIASSTGSRENVRCVCDVEEENDFMLQCEVCLYWQHGTCMGFLEDKIPERYNCFICRGQIRGKRSSYQHWYDRDWLNTGHIYGLSFLENYSQQNSKKIAATHQLLGDIQHVVEVLNGLQLKINVLQSQAHPDLKLWQKPWKLAGRSRMKSAALSDSKTLSSASSETSLHKELLSSSFTDYISSDHCYQKPIALHQVLEPRLELKTWEVEDRLYNTNSMIKNEHSIQPTLSTSCNKLSNHNKEVGKEHEVGADGGGIMGGAQQHQCKINLLEHIEAVQEEVTDRMDFIERELDVLENWLDCTGELEPPEPLDRLPELKQSVKQLLNKLGKVQQIALVCAT